MVGQTITREHLAESVQRKVGLSRNESRVLVEQVLDQICDCLAGGEPVKLSGFGSFMLRQKGERFGRNPRTGEPAPISARRIISFKASNVLKQRINSSKQASAAANNHITEATP